MLSVEDPSLCMPVLPVSIVLADVSSFSRLYTTNKCSGYRVHSPHVALYPPGTRVPSFDHSHDHQLFHAAALRGCGDGKECQFTHSD